MSPRSKPAAIKSSTAFFASSGSVIVPATRLVGYGMNPPAVVSIHHLAERHDWLVSNICWLRDAAWTDTATSLGWRRAFTMSKRPESVSAEACVALGAARPELEAYPN